MNDTMTREMVSELKMANKLTILKELYGLGTITKEEYEKQLNNAWKFEQRVESKLG